MLKVHFSYVTYLFFKGHMEYAMLFSFVVNFVACFAGARSICMAIS
jgi:hypothetical protein